MTPFPHKRIRTPRIVPYQTPGTRILVVLVALAASLAALWLAFDFGRNWQGDGDDPAEFGPAALKVHLGLLENERNDLRQKVIALERARQIDQKAMDEVKGEIKQLQEKLLAKDEELAFLRGLAATGSGKDGLHIQHFSLKKGSKAGVFQYKFTVAQMLKKIKTTNGRIWISIDGVVKGKPKALSLDEVSDESESLKMRFKNFQDVEGAVRLPAGFKPRRFKVEVKPTTKHLNPLTKSFPWEVR